MKYAALLVALALSACGGDSEPQEIPVTKTSTTGVTVIEPAPEREVIVDAPVYPHPSKL